MNTPTDNIETVARDICSRQLSRFDINVDDLTADVERYWHCVAAELESGQIDETGKRLKKVSLDVGLEAYRDWCRRHPQNKQD